MEPFTRHQRALFQFSMICALYYFLIYGVFALIRLNYRYELEWMEGGMVGHVWRLLSGQELYVKPTIDFVPYIYTPLYFWFSAGVAKLTGVGFLPLRLVSVFASIGVFALLFLIVRRLTKSPIMGLMAAGFFAAMYQLSGAWLDLARVDSLLL